MLGFFLGIISSLLVWVITEHFMSPRISISPKIAKRDTGKCHIKISNASKIRDVYEIVVHVQYHFNSGNYYRTRLDSIPLLKKKPQTIDNGVSDEQKPYEMKLMLTGPVTADRGEISLAEFFATGDQAYLDIFVISYDRFSGSTRHLHTMRYRVADIVDNSFFKDGELLPTKILSEEDGVQSKFYDHYN